LSVAVRCGMASQAAETCMLLLELVEPGSS